MRIGLGPLRELIAGRRKPVCCLRARTPAFLTQPRSPRELTEQLTATSRDGRAKSARVPAERHGRRVLRPTWALRPPPTTSPAGCSPPSSVPTGRATTAAPAGDCLRGFCSRLKAVTTEARLVWASTGRVRRSRRRRSVSATTSARRACPVVPGIGSAPASPSGQKASSPGADRALSVRSRTEARCSASSRAAVEKPWASERGRGHASRRGGGAWSVVAAADQGGALDRVSGVD